LTSWAEGPKPFADWLERKTKAVMPVARWCCRHSLFQAAAFVPFQQRLRKSAEA
jgi:hypothetical protein